MSDAPREPIPVSGLAAGLQPRPLEPRDAGAVFDLMSVVERHDDGAVTIDLADIEADWQRPSFDLRVDSVGVFDAAGLLAYGEVYKGRRAEVYVIPEARGRGIGTALLRWTWDVSRAAGGSLVGQSVPETRTGAVALFQAHDYHVAWTSWILALGDSVTIEAPDLPPGVTIREFVPGEDELAAYRVIEDAFNEWPDRQPVAFEDWAAGTLRRPGFEPWKMLLAEEPMPVGRRVVGACYVIVSDDVAWVDQLAVQRESRGRGLARALLLHAFEAARSRGARTCVLSTDSRTGALGLYEHVGMKVTQTYVHYAKAL